MWNSSTPVRLKSLAQPLDHVPIFFDKGKQDIVANEHSSKRAQPGTNFDNVVAGGYA